MSVISMKQLLEAGVHFGHQTRRWNPKMAPYIYTERNGIYIIDLQQSVGMVDDAYNAKVANHQTRMEIPRMVPCGVRLGPRGKGFMRKNLTKKENKS